MDTIMENKIRNFNPFVPHALFLYPLKTSRNLTVFCFQRLEKGCIGNEWVNIYQKSFYAYSPEKVRLTHTPDNVWDKLTYSFPMHPFLPPENIRKPKGGRERGQRKGALGMNGLNVDYLRLLPSGKCFCMTDQCSQYPIAVATKTTSAPKLQFYIFSIWIANENCCQKQTAFCLRITEIVFYQNKLGLEKLHFYGVKQIVKSTG